jgi:hypothetical protein
MIDVVLALFAGVLTAAAAGVLPIQSPVTVSLIVDGQLQPPVIIEDSRLYTLFISEDHREHLLKLEVPKAGLSAFTFMFG